MTRTDKVVEALARHALLTIDLLHKAAFATSSAKNAEAAVAEAVKDGLAAAWKFTGNKKIYSLGPEAAKRLGLNPTPFRRPPGPAAIFQRLLRAQLLVCGDTKLRPLSRIEFEKFFPELAALP